MLDGAGSLESPVRPADCLPGSSTTRTTASLASFRSTIRIPLPANECGSIGFTVGDGYLRLYVNGQMKAEEAYPFAINYTESTWIGFANVHNYKEEWIGALDEFRISDVVRISLPSGFEPLPVDEHTLALWRLDGSPTPVAGVSWGQLKALYR